MRRRRALHPPHCVRTWNRARQLLFECREEIAVPIRKLERTHEIAALARGAQVLGEPRSDGKRPSLSRMAGEDGRILHRYRDGEASIPANLDDYAFLVWGLVSTF